MIFEKEENLNLDMRGLMLFLFEESSLFKSMSHYLKGSIIEQTEPREKKICLNKK